MLVKFEQNHWSKLHEILSFLTKNQVFKNHFWQSADAILEDVSVAETIVQCKNINFQTTIFQCSKNYSSLTRVTRLKVAPNMADPISIKDWDSTFNTYTITK